MYVPMGAAFRRPSPASPSQVFVPRGAGGASLTRPQALRQPGPSDERARQHAMQMLHRLRLVRELLPPEFAELPGVGLALNSTQSPLAAAQQARQLFGQHAEEQGIRPDALLAALIRMGGKPVM